MRSMKVQIFLVMMLFLVSSCKKNKNHPVASIPFDFQIDLTLPSYQDLNGVGGWSYVSGGIKGIIVYRQSYDVFVAWERQSPEDPDNSCSSGLVTNDDNFLQLDDPCSDASFSLYDGSPLANSDWGLRQYKAEWNGSNLLRIYNQ
jgi:hypothetical protein